MSPMAFSTVRWFEVSGVIGVVVQDRLG
jgi:hypothetical protein